MRELLPRWGARHDGWKKNDGSEKVAPSEVKRIETTAEEILGNLTDEQIAVIRKNVALRMVEIGAVLEPSSK